jgi:hypothetical protein
MNENDLSDLVFKNKKEWGFQNKAHTCKKCTKATPASKKILVFSKIRLRTGCSNRSNFVQTVAGFVMGYGCAQRSARE